LEQPLSYFLRLLARLPPVPRHVVEKFGNAWLDPEHLVTYGPFRLEAWDRGKSLRFVRNPDYRGDVGGNVERVEWIATHRPEDNLKMYEGGELDVMAFDGMVVDDVTPMRHYAGYAMMPDVMCRCVVFDPSRPPFDDKRVRQAFAHATDQEGLIKSIWRGFYLPATGGIIPPGMPGHTAGIVLPFDPPRARQLLAEAGYPDGLGFPFVDARTINWKGAAFVDNYLKEQWRTHLGIDIVWQYWGDYGNLPNMHRVGFDPECDPDVLFRGSVNFAFRTNSWGNALFDERVRLAHHCHDHTERLRLYRQAEEIMLDDAVIIPLFYHWPPYLIQPWVKNFTTSVTGDWYWKHVILEPH
jgi:oligopeptide transport system substrate-binding protein